MVIFLNGVIFLSLKIGFCPCKSCRPYKMLHYVAFHFVSWLFTQFSVKGLMSTKVLT